MNYRLLIVTLIALALCSGCGEHRQDSERYERIINHPNSTYAKRIGAFHIQLLMRGSYTRSIDSSDSMLLDSFGTVQPPYTLIISSSYYGNTEDVVEIVAVEMQIGNQEPVILHSESENSIRVPFEPWLDHAISATLKMGLGDSLPFIEGEEVRMTVKVRLPETKQLESISTLFLGKKKLSVSSKFWTFILGA